MAVFSPGFWVSLWSNNSWSVTHWSHGYGFS